MNTRKEAELEKFFEKDIIEFLDEKKAQKGAKNELKELEELIKNKKYIEASKIIEEAINKFNNTPQEDVYKEIRFNKIIELVKIAKELTKNIYQNNRLIEDLEIIEKSGQLGQDSITIITAFEERKRKEKQEKNEQEKQDRDLARNITNQMTEINKKLFVSIRKKDLLLAVDQYRELKELFQQYPYSLLNEKKELYNDIIAFYMRIKKLKEEIQESQRNRKTQGIQPKRKIKYLKIEEIKTIVESVKQDINKKRYKEAKSKVINLKHTISLIPEEFINIKKNLQNVADVLMQKIEFEKRMNNQNNN